MNELNTNVSTNVASKPSALERPSVGYAALLIYGFVLAGIHQITDLSLGLPGHFGLIWMAALIFARLRSPLNHTASITACGYILGGTLLHHFSPTLVSYLAVAMLLDAVFRILPGAMQRAVFLAPIGATLFAIKVLFMALLGGFFMLKGGALQHGIGFPLLTHFCFGLVGTVLGTLLAQAVSKR